MPKKYYQVQNKTQQSADILIYGVIGDSWWEESITARQFVADLKSLEKDHPRINVRINSPGGSVFDGLPIFNALKNSTADIHTYNDGLCASMAALVLLAGKTVHTADNALMMLHSPMSGCQGNASDIQQVLDMLDKVQDSLITCITSRKGTAVDEIKSKYFDYKDHWLNADEAQSEGFIDVVEKGDKKISSKITNMSLSEIMNQFDSLVKGKSLFDKFFTQAHDFFTPIDTLDMDIKLLRNACGLAEDASEQQVLDFIAANKPTATADPTPAPEPAVDPEPEPTPAPEPAAVDPKDLQIANLERQIATLRSTPGAVNTKAPIPVDGATPANDSFETYKNARDTYNAVTSLLK